MVNHFSVGMSRLHMDQFFHSVLTGHSVGQPQNDTVDSSSAITLFTSKNSSCLIAIEIKGTGEKRRLNEYETPKIQGWR